MLFRKRTYCVRCVLVLIMASSAKPDLLRVLERIIGRAEVVESSPELREAPIVQWLGTFAPLNTTLSIKLAPITFLRAIDTCYSIVCAWLWLNLSTRNKPRKASGLGTQSVLFIVVCYLHQMLVANSPK